MSLLLLVLSACTYRPPEPEEEPPAPPGPTHALVWTATRSGEGPDLELGLRTRWVVIAPEGGVEVRGEVDGLVTATDDGLRRVLPSRADRPGRACGGGDTVRVERALLWGPPGAEASVIDPLAPDADLPADEPYEWLDAVDVDGQIGPWLFVHGTAMDFGCGAHPNTHHAAKVVDLRTGEAWDVLRDEAVRGLVDAVRAELVAPFVAPGPDGTPRTEVLGVTDLEIARLLPRWTPEGLVVGVQVAAPTCYACGDGRWSSYTVSEARDLPALPLPFTPWATPPAWLGAVQPADGWSLAAPALEPQLAALFAAPPAPVEPAAPAAP